MAAAPRVGQALKTTLVYWDIRGLAQPIRFALEHAGCDYEDVRLDAGDPNSESYKKAWFDVKPTLGLDFPNLPYLLDGDVSIVQSGAILRHLCRKHGLGPKGDDLAAAARADFLLEQLGDFDGSLTGMCYRGHDDGGKERWIEGVMLPALRQFEAVLAASGQPFLCGDAPGAADFKGYEDFDKCRLLSAGCLDQFPALKAYVERFETLPRIAAYLASPRFKARPVNNPHAQFK
eukprot:SRR837773.15921.p1 GENE.SRR837773.15921~~SRR837773.15921.p1  ORF type:complete len:247 (-),score=96.04 SRR837773.15921:83-781(-)